MMDNDEMIRWAAKRIPDEGMRRMQDGGVWLMAEYQEPILEPMSWSDPVACEVRHITFRMIAPNRLLGEYRGTKTGASR